MKQEMLPPDYDVRRAVRRKTVISFGVFGLLMALGGGGDLCHCKF
jgi:hypothetical protein